jgi:thioesterase III
METAHEIVVRPTEVDVNGHVNNAKYVEYMEWGARNDMSARDLPTPGFWRSGP